jgi:NTE family protein
MVARGVASGMSYAVAAMTERSRIALVLGAGGPVGFAFHAGVLLALAQAGWDARDADVVVGTSIGAVTGGLLRAGMGAEDLFARAVGGALSAPGEALVATAGGWPSFTAALQERADSGGAGLFRRPPAAPNLLAELARNPARFRPGLLLAGLLPAGTIDPGPIVSSFDQMLGGVWPDRDLWVCATDLDRGERTVFGAPGGPTTSVGTAVAASSAVPSVFAPVEVDGRRYVDGGSHSPANTDVLAPLTAELAAVVVSVPMGIGARPGRGGPDLPGRWFNHRSAWRGLAPLREAGVPVLLVEPGPSELGVMGYDAFDLTHRAEIAGRAHAALAGRLAGGAESIVAVRSPLGLVG